MESPILLTPAPPRLSLPSLQVSASPLIPSIPLRLASLNSRSALPPPPRNPGFNDYIANSAYLPTPHTSTVDFLLFPLALYFSTVSCHLSKLTFINFTGISFTVTKPRCTNMKFPLFLQKWESSRAPISTDGRIPTSDN